MTTASRASAGAEIGGEFRRAMLLPGNPAFDFAQRHDAQIKVLLRLRFQPGDDLRGAVRTTQRREHIGIEEIDQNSTGRGAASAR